MALQEKMAIRRLPFERDVTCDNGHEIKVSHANAFTLERRLTAALCFPSFPVFIFFFVGFQLNNGAIIFLPFLTLKKLATDTCFPQRSSQISTRKCNTSVRNTTDPPNLINPSYGLLRHG